MRPRNLFPRQIFQAAVWSVGLLSCTSSRALRLETARELLAVEVIAAGLQWPASLAFDPVQGELYVAEQDGRRVSVIRDKEAVPVVEGVFNLYPRKKGRAATASLAEPSSIAFDAKGRLYVAERQGPARLLRFESLSTNSMRAAEINTPWAQSPQVCTSLAADSKGRLYVTLQNGAGRIITAFGTVVLLDTDGRWRLIDYGPFADFSNVALSSEGHVLAVGERRKADVSWYDADRQIEMRSLENLDGLRHVSLLPDGTTIISLYRADGSWSLAEVDAVSGRVWEWVGGLGEISALIAHPQTGDLYVALAKEGRILRVRRLNTRENAAFPDSALGRMRRAFEMQNAIPPPEWPDFFKTFIERLGLVQAVNMHRPREMESGEEYRGMPMTLAEFSSSIPVVAAKVRARLLSPDEPEDDPVEELSFLLFHPNRSMLTRQATAPSVSLFWARHRSGRISRSQFMPGKRGVELSEELAWNDLPKMLVSFPAGFYAPETGVADNSLLRVYFLGSGLGPDYWIDLDRHDSSRSRMIVEKPGGEKVNYLIEPYVESPSAGGQTVLVAGTKEVVMGWPDLGQDPIPWKIVTQDAPVIRTRHSMDINSLRVLPLPVRAAVADRALPQPAAPGTELYRRLVLRAATRWSDQGL